MRGHDGYTLMIGNVSTNAITPVIVPERLKSQLQPRRRAGDQPDRHPGLPGGDDHQLQVKSVPELIEYAKKNPGKLRYGTVGAGSYPHYDMAFFAKRAGDLNMVAIHNKAGASGVINDMVTGDVQVAFLNVGSTIAQIKAGKLRPIAIVNHSRCRRRTCRP